MPRTAIATLPVPCRYAIVDAMSCPRRFRFPLHLLVLVAALAMVAGACAKKNHKNKHVGKTPAPGSTGEPSIVRAKPTGKPVANKKKPPFTPLATDTGKNAINHTWSLRFGNKGRDNARNIAIDSKGNIYLVGLFTGKVDFGNKKPVDGGKLVNVFLAKYTADGELKWVKNIGNKGEENATAVGVDKDDNVVIAGWFSNQLRIGGTLLDAEHEADNIFIAKYNSAGKLQWAKDFGSNGNDVANAVAIDSAGNIIFTGAYQQFIDFGSGKLRSNGNDDVYLTKLDKDGNHVWSRSFGALHNDMGWSVVVDVQDNIYWGGDLTRNTKLGGKKLPNRGETDAAICKFDSDGNVLWVKTFGGFFKDMLIALAVDPAGGVIATGAFTNKMTVGETTLKAKGRMDIYVVKLDAKGEIAWAKAYGNRFQDTGLGVSTNKFGTIMVTGQFESKVNFGGGTLKSHGNKDIFLLKLAADGRHLWSTHFGAKGDDMGRSVIIDDDGLVTVSGTFRYKLDLGGPVLDATLDMDRKIPPGDAFLARFAP